MPVNTGQDQVTPVLSGNGWQVNISDKQKDSWLATIKIITMARTILSEHL